MLGAVEVVEVEAAVDEESAMAGKVVRCVMTVVVRVGPGVSTFCTW